MTDMTITGGGMGMSCAALALTMAVPVGAAAQVAKSFVK